MSTFNVYSDKNTKKRCKNENKFNAKEDLE
jgi:hypothetical protein